MGFELLGLGFAVSKTIENGNGIYIFIWYTGISNNWDWDFEGGQPQQKLRQMYWKLFNPYNLSHYTSYFDKKLFLKGISMEIV